MGVFNHLRDPNSVDRHIVSAKAAASLGFTMLLVLTACSRSTEGGGNGGKSPPLDPASFFVGLRNTDVLSKEGQPEQVITNDPNWKPTFKIPFRLNCDKKLKYDRRWYYIDGSQAVVGFSESSPLPRPMQDAGSMPSVQDVNGNLAGYPWDRVVVIGREQHVSHLQGHLADDFPLVDAYSVVEGFVFELHAYCLDVAEIDPKTYTKKYRLPIALGECKYLGLSVFAPGASVPSGASAEDIKFPMVLSATGKN